MELNKLEINKLFVKFLEWEVEQNNDVNVPMGLYKPQTEREIESGFWDYKIDMYDFEFSSDWSYLMAVVEKIEKIVGVEKFNITKSGVVISYIGGYNIHELCSISYYKVIYYGGLYPPISEVTKIQAVFESCFNFIQWYLENKPNKQ